MRFRKEDGLCPTLDSPIELPGLGLRQNVRAHDFLAREDLEQTHLSDTAKGDFVGFGTVRSQFCAIEW